MTIRIGVSSCLLGEKVRYDGGHKRNAFLSDVLGDFVEWVPVCPEVDIGLGTPRPTIRLEKRDEEVRLVAPKDQRDLTLKMKRYAEERVRDLAGENLDGYVLKKDSPSCGLFRVRIYNESGMPERNGTGMFAMALTEGLPNLPVEEEGRLANPKLRENFIERVFAYNRLRALFSTRWTLGDLVSFHTAHKMTLLAHDATAYKKLGRLVAEGKSLSRDELRRMYETDFMGALAAQATTKRHVNVLQHMAGHFKDNLDGESKKELHSVIEDYAAGLIPLVVPLTLIKHHVRERRIEYLAGQVYLDSHPKELMLRNHV